MSLPRLCPPSPRQTGTSSIEYAVIASLVSVAIVGALWLIGPRMADMFQTVADKV